MRRYSFARRGGSSSRSPGSVLYERALADPRGRKRRAAAVAAISGLERGSLSIGTCASLNAFFDLPLLLGEFHALHPAIEIRLCHSTAAKLMDKVKDGSVDLAFLPLYEKSRATSSRCRSPSTGSSWRPAGHPLEGRENVSLHSLAGETFVDFQHDQGTRRIVDRAFGGAQRIAQDGARGRRRAGAARSRGARLRHRTRAAYVRASPRRRRDGPQIGIATLKRPGIRWELVMAFGERPGAVYPKNPATRAFAQVLASARAGGRVA